MPKTTFPSNSTTQIIQKNGEDWIRYTPSSEGTVTFDYTASDGNGGTDTATVTVNVTESCPKGEITVEFQDKNGDSEEASAQVEYNDDDDHCTNEVPQQSFTCEVKLFDNGRDAVIEKSDITPPSGYRVLEDNWVNKFEAVKTYDEPWKSELGF